MSNIGFNRDEVILALDVLYSSEKMAVPVNSPEMKELCAILQNLPIYPQESRRKPDFRTLGGVSQQLRVFKRYYRINHSTRFVGRTFFTVADEFEDNVERLHEIACAIRSNLSWFDSSFGADTESEGFPEGVLLGHLHRNLERRDGKRVPLGDCCSVCQLQPELLYQPCGNLLEHHLIIDPVRLDGSKRYGADKFITVCPNCHAALHRFRPWLDKENCEALLL